jgi:ABC-type multidrug transport system ATPase subunit
MPSVIEVRHCSKLYRKIKALDNISFEVYPGEIFGLVGPNGAGKTTLVRILTTLLQPSSGTISVLGKDIRYQHKEIRKEIGYVPSNPVVYKHLSAWENLILFSSLHSIPSHKASSRIETLLTAFDLWRWRNEKVKNFSSGMTQKVNIIRGILHQPKVLILDEPTTGLDPISRRVVRDFIIETHQKGTTVIFTTHVMWEVEEICHRIGIMHQGRFVGLNTMDQFYNDYFKLRQNYELRVRGPIPPALVNQINNLPYVQSINKGQHDFVIRISNEADPELLLQFLHNAGIPLRSLEWMKPSLEEIFIQRTS